MARLSRIRLKRTCASCLVLERLWCSLWTNFVGPYASRLVLFMFVVADVYGRHFVRFKLSSRIVDAMSL